MGGLTFGVKHTSEFGLVVESDNRSLKPAKRVSEEVIPGKHGSYKFEDGYNDRLIAAKCSLLVQGIENRRATARAIASWLSRQDILRFDDEPDKYYIGRLDEQIDLDTAVAFDTFSLSFVCHPIAYSEIIQVKRKNITAPAKMLVSNRGTVEYKPLIEISGTATTVTFTCPAGAFSIANITKKTYIDCDRMIVYTYDAFGKKQNKLMDYTGSFLALQPGTTEISISGTNLNIDVVINTQDAYL